MKQKHAIILAKYSISSSVKKLVLLVLCDTLFLYAFFQGILGIAFQFYSDIFALIELVGFAFSLIAALAVCSLLYFRYKDPNARTTFKLPLFFPIAFLLGDLFILILTIYQQPRESLSNLILILSAIPIYITFANRAMPWFSLAMPVFVGASVFGSINGEVLSMSRLTFTGAREGHMPTILALVHHTNLTPLPSILAIVR
nr:unnamed protein product [Spirometra erinaceieuropaei]